jgi:hypothetical protein
METRKRHIVDADDESHRKKRPVIEMNGTPVSHPNGLPGDQDEPKDENVEVLSLIILPCYALTTKFPRASGKRLYIVV